MVGSSRTVARLRQRRWPLPLILGQESNNSRMQENTVAVRILRIGQEISQIYVMACFLLAFAFFWGGGGLWMGGSVSLHGPPPPDTRLLSSSHDPILLYI